MRVGALQAKCLKYTYIILEDASSKQLLQSFGIIEKENDEREKEKRIIIYPNCNEPNNRLENKFCFKCKIVLSISSYNDVRNEDKRKIDKLENEALLT